MRRRLYLMRHAAVAYVGPDGRPVDPDDVALTPAGVEQAQRAAAVLGEVRIDRVITSGLRRTLETARIAAPGHKPEVWPEVREVRPGHMGQVSAAEAKRLVTRAFAGDVPLEATFLGGESFGSLVDRVASAVERLAADPAWDTVLAVLHGGVNRALLSYVLTGERRFLGSFEQAPGCFNVLDLGDDGWIVRAVNVNPSDLLHLRTRATTMEELWAEYVPYRQGR